MLRTLKPFEYFEPRTISEALQILSNYGSKAKVLAGGTDLLVSMKKKEITPQHILYIKGIPGLDYIKYGQKDGLRIGALTPHRSVADSSVVKDKFGLLATACGKVGSLQIRTMGTLGGNICKAGPSQDSIPALLVLDAKLKLSSLDGDRVVPANEFFIAPFQTVLKENELLTEIQIPSPPPRSGGCYHWFTKATAVDETLVGVAILITPDSKSGFCKDIKIGLGSVAPTPIRARRAEELLKGKKIDDKLMEEAARVAVDETVPRSRAEFRRRVTGVLVERAINEAWHKVK